MDFLLEILGETLFNQVKAILEEKKVKIGNIGDGSYIPKDKFDSKIAENKLLKEQIEEHKGNVTTLEKSLKDKLSQEHKEEINKMISEFNTKLSQKDEAINNMSKENMLKNIFQENKAIDPNLLLKAVDLNGIEIEGDKLKNFDIEAFKMKYPQQFTRTEQRGNVNPKQSQFQGNKNTAVQQLIEKHNKTTDITQRHILRQQIKELKQNE